MSAIMPFSNISLTNFQAVRPKPVPRSTIGRLQAWLARRSRARMAAAERAELRERWPHERGTVLTLDCERGSPPGHLARLYAAATGSIDAVISVGALADAAHVELVLSEIKRVLRPGARMLFAEPVAAPAGTRLRRVQGCLGYAWRLLVGSENVPRDLWNDLKAARFDRLTFDTVTLAGVGGVPVPHLIGEAAVSVSARTPVARHRGHAVGVPNLGWRSPASAFFG